MTFKALVQTVARSVETLNLSDRTDDVAAVDRVIIGVLLYDILNQLINQNNAYSSNLSTTANSYARNMQSTVDSMKLKYTTYGALSKKVKEYKIKSFVDISRIQLENLLSIYANKVEIEKFNSNKFSPTMYNVFEVTSRQHDRLQSVHNKVIIPLVKHYKISNGIKDSDVSVEDTYSINPGKEIKISLKGINSSKILSDVKFDKIGIRDYLHDYKLTSDGYLLITVK